MLVVSQAKPELLRLFLKSLNLPFTVVSDPERKLYHTFGLQRVSWLTFLHPKVLWGYIRLLFLGVGFKAPSGEEDLLQLGGDFVLNRAGDVISAFTSWNPTARPSMEEILAAVASAAPGG